MKKTKTVPVVPREHIVERIRRGDRAAREDFIRSNQGLVIHIAKKYAYTADVLADLIAEGNMGLLKAIDKFDPSRNVKFGTYAYFWIKRFVLRALMRDFELLKVPEKIQGFKEKYDEIEQDYQGRLGRNPTEKEFADGLEMSLKDLRKLKGYTDHVRGVISASYYDGEKDTDLFQLVDFGKGGESDFWDLLRNQDILDRVFARLASKERRANIDLWLQALKLHFGLGNTPPKSYKEISEELGVSRQRVHQIIKVCLKKLQLEWKEMQRGQTGNADS